MKKALFLLFVDLLVAVGVFASAGLYNTGLDTGRYVNQINYFAGQAVSAEQIFKPFYGVIGSWLPFTPYNDILILNLIFLVGLSFAVYYFLKSLDFGEREALAGTVWVITGYPLLKYGLGLGTDLSGWFFMTATITVFLSALKQERVSYVILASLLGFLGSLAKETGVLGLLFAGFYLLLSLRDWPVKKVLGWLSALVIPFLALQSLLLLSLSESGSGGFLGWFASNQGYVNNYRTLTYFLGVEASTWHVVWLLALVGLVLSLRQREFKNWNWVKVYLALALASLPVLLWPVFISRILFVHFVFLVPLALYSLKEIKRPYLLALPPVVSVILYSLSGSGSLFALLQQFLARF